MITLNPDAAGLYFERGMVNYATDKFNDAISDYNKAISLGFNRPEIFVWKSQAFAELGEYDIAIESINQALGTKKGRIIL